MKSTTDVLAELGRRLERAWAPTIAGVDTPWTSTVTLHAPTGATLADDFAPAQAWARAWTRWAEAHQVQLTTATRKVGPTYHPFPTGLLVPDLDTGARLVAGPWPNRLAVARERAARLREQFAHLQPGPDLVRLVREAAAMPARDFDLLIAAGHWCATHETAGLTPRQVPVPGMHAKWLNTSAHLVATLAGRPCLDLAPAHAPVVHMTYLDPDHLAAGGRRHDAHTIGDHVTPAYPVQVVLISENKDTAVMFEPVRGAVAVQGGGANVAVIADLPWVRAAPLVVYWGDIDADGLTILAQLRATGLSVTSMLMDTDAYEQWGRYGTSDDRFGRPLSPRPSRDGLDLTAEEAALYRRLVDPAFTGYRRVEQERIPLPYAREVLTALVRHHLHEQLSYEGATTL